MTLLRQIQEEAVSGTVDLATVLRRCRLLSSRLDSDVLEQWIEWESDGYPKSTPVPDYRVLNMRVLGHFSGPFGTGLRNAEIPLMNIPQELRRMCSVYEARESVQVMEGLVSESEGLLRVPIPSDALRFFSNVYEHMHCLSAWGVLSRTQLLGILSGVRNRILDFAMKIETLDPAAGEAEPGKPALESRAVNQVFNTTVYGGATNIVGTAQGSTIIAENIVRGDFESVRQVLVNAGLDEADVGELERALDVDPPPSEEGKFGLSVGQWIGKMVGKAASGAWKVSTTIATELLTKAISAYYGIGVP